MNDIYHQNQIIKWAHSAWKRFGETPPVNLADISDFLGLRVVTDTLSPGTYGVYTRRKDGECTAFLEAALPDYERMRVWAHEIGHHLLPKDTLGVIELRCSMSNNRDALERDCDLFAKHLIMPEYYVRQKAEQLGHPAIDRTFALAGAFGVPKEVMEARLRELRLYKSRKTTIDLDTFSRECEEYANKLRAE